MTLKPIDVWTEDGNCKICGESREDCEALDCESDRDGGHLPGCPVGMLASAVVVVPTSHVYYNGDNYRCLGRDDENLNHTISDATNLGRSIGRYAAERHVQNAQRKGAGWGGREEGLVEVQWDEAHLRLAMPVRAMEQIRVGYEETWGAREKVLRHAERVDEAERVAARLRSVLRDKVSDLERMQPELTPAAVVTRMQAIEVLRQQIVAAQAVVVDLKKQVL
jgi:hypothetical protein